MLEIIETAELPNDYDLVVDYITLINRSGGLYDIAAVYESVMDMCALAVYEEKVMTNIFMADDDAEIRNFTENDLTNGEIFIWNRNMQSCIETIQLQEY